MIVTNINVGSKTVSVRRSHRLAGKQMPEITIDEISSDFEQDNKHNNKNANMDKDVQDFTNGPRYFPKLNKMIVEDSTPNSTPLMSTNGK